MSKITLSGNASGTGTLTIAAPNTDTDRTLDLPNAGGTVVLDTATQTLTNKTLITPNIDSAQFATVTGTAPLYSARAWVNFNGTGTVAIRAAGNVTSITDNGVGDYTLNFTTALPDTTYTAVGSAIKNGGFVRIFRPDTYATTSLRCTTGGGSGSYLTSANDDSAEINVAIFR